MDQVFLMLRDFCRFDSGICRSSCLKPCLPRLIDTLAGLFTRYEVVFAGGDGEYFVYSDGGLPL